MTADTKHIISSWMWLCTTEILFFSLPLCPCPLSLGWARGVPDHTSYWSSSTLTFQVYSSVNGWTKKTRVSRVQQMQHCGAPHPSDHTEMKLWKMADTLKCCLMCNLQIDIAGFNMCFMPCFTFELIPCCFVKRHTHDFFLLSLLFLRVFILTDKQNTFKNDIYWIQL